MNSFIVEIYDKNTASSLVAEITISGGAYSVNINGTYIGTMIKDNTLPHGHYTTDKKLEPYLESIAYGLNNRKKKIPVRELITAIVGILQLISFLFGTVVSFKLKETMQRTRIFLLFNFLPLLLECVALDYVTATHL